MDAPLMTIPPQAPKHQHPQLASLSRKPSFVMKATTIKAPLLQPVALTPQRLSSAASSFTFLERIERIEINSTVVRDGVTFYVLDVFLYHFNSRLPTNVTNHRSLVRSTRPDFQVERRFSEFVKLRSQVSDATLINMDCMCSYCAEFSMYVRFKMQQPRALTKLTMLGTEKRRKMLVAFLNDFVALGRSKEKANYYCENHEPVPHLLEEFVRGDNSELMVLSERASILLADPLA